MRESFEELIAKYKAETTAPALEILEHIHQALVALPEVNLKDGSKVRFEPYQPPGVDAAGEIACGVDVRLEDGSHLEFTVQNTGWGKSFAKQVAKPADKPEGKGRGR